MPTLAQETDRQWQRVGLDLNELSSLEIAKESENYSEMNAVRGDAFRLPFDDGAFDYAICSLFTHHLTDEQVPKVLREMSRVSSRGIVVIDLERNAMAWFLFNLFCLAYRISPLVRQDGSLSIKKGFRESELRALATEAGLANVSVQRHAPYRVVLRCDV